MRLVILALFGLAGCVFDASRESDGFANPGDDDAQPGYGECATADDCVAVSASCCGCPGFAQADDGRGDDCDDVECPSPPPEGCPAVEPACVDGACTLACAAVTCEMTCPTGFATDEAGCLVCGCADAPAPMAECAEDADCARVAADCCGCARGGADTAVPVGAVDAHNEALDCGPSPACPEVDVCEPEATPRCAAGRCVLDVAADSEDGPLCGRPDLPPCPEGTACTLNTDAEASMDGVGTCQPT